MFVVQDTYPGVAQDVKPVGVRLAGNPSHCIRKFVVALPPKALALELN